MQEVRHHEKDTANPKIMCLGGMEELCCNDVADYHNRIFKIFNDPSSIVIGGIDRNYQKVA